MRFVGGFVFNWMLCCLDHYKKCYSIPGQTQKKNQISCRYSIDDGVFLLKMQNACTEKGWGYQSTFYNMHVCKSENKEWFVLFYYKSSKAK